MTSLSESAQKASEILEQIIEDLDEERLKVKIDEPVDKALDAVRGSFPEERSLRNFHGVISHFVRSVYEQGLQLSRQLSPAQALSEAIATVQQGYGGIHCDGYEEALLDAMNPEMDGFEYVVTRMAEIIKERKRAEYTRWIFWRRIGSCDWKIRCEIAELLVNRSASFLPPDLSRCTPAQLADQIPSLIGIEILADLALRKMLSSNNLLQGP
jgi:hypothetical protein